MSTSLLYHAFRIRGYKYTRTEYRNGQVIFTIDQEPENLPLFSLRFDSGYLSGRSRSLPEIPTHRQPSNVRSLCHTTHGMSVMWASASGRCLFR